MLYKYRNWTILYFILYQILLIYENNISEMSRSIIYWSLSIYFFDLVWPNFELKNSSSELDTYRPIVDEGEVLLQLNQCSKFGLSVCDIEFSIFQDYLSMFSRNWDVGYSNLAFVASTDFYGNFLLSRNEMEASFLFIFLLVVNAL